MMSGGVSRIARGCAGALAYYFQGKDELLRAAFECVLAQTSSRITTATRELRGLAALRAFCAEMLPIDELRVLEARVVVPFWSSALTDRSFAELHEQALAGFRKALRKYLSQAVSLREIPPPNTPKQHTQAAETLLSILHGAQVLGVLSPERHTKAVIWAMVEDFVRQLEHPKGHP